MNIINVLVADDIALIRAGIATMLKEEKHINIIGYAKDGLEAYQKIIELKPDITLLDISMPNMNGFELMKKLNDNNILFKVVIMSLYENQEYREMAINLGAKAYVVKGDEFNLLSKTIENAYYGKSN